MSANFYELLKYAATGIASHEMTYFDKMRALSMAGGTVKTLTGVPPLSFKANGKPLISWSMLGNGQQTGTPTPDAPIMPTFCGVRTRNLINVYANDTSNGYINNALIRKNGSIYTPSSAFISEYQPINESITYTLNTGGKTGDAQSICFYTSDKQFISGIEYASETIITFTTPQGARYFRCAIMRTKTDTESYKQTMLNAGSTPLPYEPYGWKISFTNAGQTTLLYLGEVSTVRRIKRLVLTGSETVSFNAKNENRGRFAVTIPLSYRGTSTPTNIISTHFPTLDSTGEILLYTGICMRSTATDMVLAMSYSEVSVEPPTDATLLHNAVKSYLAAQYAAGTPVTVWYVLAEPETAIVNEPLAKIGDYADELNSTDAGVSIPTVKGDNTLTVETDLQPSGVTIRYKADE